MIIDRSLYGRVNQGRYDGPFDIPAGTVKVTSTPDQPARRRTVLHDQLSGSPVREMWSSASDGAYQFRRVAAGVYFVVSFDHTGLYNGEVVTDIVVPEPAP